MPKLNLRDDGFEDDSSPLDSDQPVAPPPTLREVGGSGGGGGKSSTLLTILLIVVVLAGGVFALNYFKVIHLWGKRTPKIDTQQFTDQLPLPDTNPVSGSEADSLAAAQAGGGEATPMPEASLAPTGGTTTAGSGVTHKTSPVTKSPVRSTEPAPTFSPPPSSGTGTYTVQVSSWTSKGMAEQEASRLTAAGMNAFVEDAVIAGENWYRVRVGRYATSREAKEAADQLAKSLDGNIWVARTGGR